MQNLYCNEQNGFQRELSPAQIQQILQVEKVIYRGATDLLNSDINMVRALDGSESDQEVFF